MKKGAVSYTHLDVYKRQILLRQDIISNIENYLCLVRSAETLVNDSKKSAVAVSYTHLDVYKRQIWNRGLHHHFR